MTANYSNIIHGYVGTPSGNSSFLERRKLAGSSPRPHEGVDLAAPAGTAIYASVGGEVVQSWVSATLGKVKSKSCCKFDSINPVFASC